MNNHVYFVQQVLSLVNERNAVSKSYTVGIDGVDIIRFLQKEGRGTSNISIKILRRDFVRTEDAFNDKIQGRAWWFVHVPYVLAGRFTKRNYFGEFICNDYTLPATSPVRMWMLLLSYPQTSISWRHSKA
jgi:hypothetical protein